MFPSRCFLVVLLVVIELSVANNNLCPPGYWGSMCKPCEACTVGNGACDGDGRGTGTGKCICEKAWLGSTCNLTSCFGKVISVPHDFLAFAACSTIKGPLVINATSLLDVEPLAHVHTIAGVDETGNSISIYDNANLLNVTGLRGLRKLAGAVVVDKNPMLESLDGLEQVHSIGINVRGDSIYVVNNNILKRIDGLRGLKFPPKGQIRAWGNGQLTGQARQNWHDPLTPLTPDKKYGYIPKYSAAYGTAGYTSNYNSDYRGAVAEGTQTQASLHITTFPMSPI